MNHPFQESLNNIEKRLEELTKIVAKRQSPLDDDMFIDNKEFQGLMNVSSNTEVNWREQGLIAFSQINNKFYYKIKDIKKLLDDHYHPLKKK